MGLLVSKERFGLKKKMTEMESLQQTFAVIPVSGGTLICSGGLFVSAGLLMNEYGFATVVESKEDKAQRKSRDIGSIVLYVVGLILMLIGIIKACSRLPALIVGIFAVFFFAIGVFLFRQEIVELSRPMARKSLKPIQKSATAFLILSMACFAVSAALQTWQNAWQYLVCSFIPFLLLLLAYYLDRRTHLHGVVIFRSVIVLLVLGWILAGGMFDMAQPAVGTVVV